VRLAHIERWTETDGERTTLHDEDDLFTVTYPADWIVADEPINTWVSSPFEILALGTYRLRPGGEAVIDAQVPSNAIDDLGPNDIFIWVNDGGDDEPGFPDRPDRFEPSRLCGEDFAQLCPDPEGRSLGIPGIRSWWLRFGDGGRGSMCSWAWESKHTRIRHGRSLPGRCWIRSASSVDDHDSQEEERHGHDQVGRQ
jgi:hypothetical protein